MTTPRRSFTKAVVRVSRPIFRRPRSAERDIALFRCVCPDGRFRIPRADKNGDFWQKQTAPGIFWPEAQFLQVDRMEASLKIETE